MRLVHFNIFRLFKGPIRVNPLPTNLFALEIISKLFWLTYRFIIPIYYLNVPLGMFWTIFFVTEMVTGWHIALNTQVFSLPNVTVHQISVSEQKIIIFLCRREPLPRIWVEVSFVLHSFLKIRYPHP